MDKQKTQTSTGANNTTSITIKPRVGHVQAANPALHTCTTRQSLVHAVAVLVHWPRENR